MKRFCVILACLLVVVVVGCGQSQDTAPTTARPVELQVMPTKLRPGMRAVMVGVGFDSGEQVAFYLIRPDGSRTPEGESTADKNGGAAIQFDVMDDWKPGQYIVHVQSRKNPARGAEQKIELRRQ